MEKEYRYKIVIDPVHGDIGLSELETKIIDTPTFQRLRRLKQLGFASMVYPNASHSRFAHSLGVLHIANRVIEIFRANGQLTNDQDVEKLRAAALLHDIGHYPYSHLMESIDWDRYITKYLAKKDGGNQGNSQVPNRYPDHGEIGRLVVTKRNDITKILQAHEIDPTEIAALIEGKHANIPNLLHKSLDVDRIDYLVRDSLNTGVPYGQIDINYILNNLDLGENQEIVLNAKARISAEHLLLARYFMFNSVYLHKTVFGFEEVVRRIILLLLGKGEIYTSGSEIEEMVTEDSHEFLDFHDGYLDKLIDEYAERNDYEPLSIMCRAVKLRRPPSLIHEVVDLYDSQRGNPSPEYVSFRRCMDRELRDIASQSQIHPDCLICREPKDVRFEALNPFTSMSRARDAKEEEMRQLVRIKESSGNIRSLISDKNSIIHHLSQLTLKVIRLYAVESDAGKIEKLKTEVQKRV